VAKLRCPTKITDSSGPAGASEVSAVSVGDTPRPVATQVATAVSRRSAMAAWATSREQIDVDRHMGGGADGGAVGRGRRTR
jgi:hypothetical protein